MSSSKFARMLAEMGNLRPQLERLAAEISASGVGRTLDPDIVAARFGWKPGETLGFLRLAQEAGLGRMRLRVVGEDGEEIGRFDDLASIPPEVEDDFGRSTRVTPERVEVVFEAGNP